jgi:flagellar protein FliS
MNYYAGFEYRKRAVEGTSPIGLVVMLYGTIVASLLRAQAAVKSNDIEKRVLELNHVLRVIGQLQGTLDFERGGEVAAHLDRFYGLMRARVMEASMRNSIPILQELVGHFSSLREAWQVVERSVALGGGMAQAEPQIPASL